MNPRNSGRPVYQSPSMLGGTLSVSTATVGVRSTNPHLCSVGLLQCQLNQYFTQLTEPLHTEGPEMVFSKTEE